MSYILDALKKAESERKLGSIPNLHARQVTTTALDDGPSIWSRPVTWIVLALAAATVVALAWKQPWQVAPIAVGGTAPSIMVASDAPPAVMPAAPEKVTPASLVATPAVPLAAPSRPVITAPLAKPIASTPEKRDVAKLPEPPTVAKQGAPAIDTHPVVSAPLVATTPAAAPAAPPPDTSVMSLRELPENIQRELPTLAISGYIYSSNPAERSILINRVLRREGDEVAPGLTLEKMMPKSAVMSYRGYRYRMSY